MGKRRKTESIDDEDEGKRREPSERPSAASEIDRTPSSASPE